MRELIDAESDKQNPQERENDDFVKEEHKRRKEDSDVRKQAHVEAKDDGGSEQQQAVEEAPRGGFGVLPEHAREEALRQTRIFCNGLLVVFRALERSIVGAARHLRNSGHDAIVVVLLVASVAGLKANPDPQREQEPREKTDPRPAGYGVNELKLMSHGSFLQLGLRRHLHISGLKAQTNIVGLALDGTLRGANGHTVDGPRFLPPASLFKTK